MSREKLLELFESLEQGQSLIVDNDELGLCNELRREGRVDFEPVPTSTGEDRNSKIELRDPVFIV